MKRLFCMTLLALALTACSQRAWYTGVQTGARANCQQQVAAEQQKQCEARLNQQDFDTYQRNRAQP